MFRMRSSVFFIATVLSSGSALAQTTTAPPPAPTLAVATVNESTLNLAVRSDLGTSTEPNYVNPAISYYEVTTSVLGGTLKTTLLPPGETVYSLDLSSGGTAMPMPNTTVTVTAKAVSPTGVKSAASAPFTANTAPAVPTGVTGIGGRNRVTVSWQPSAGAAKYMVTLSNGMSYTTASTSQVFSGLPTATSYNAVVWAYNSVGVRSAGSTVVKVSTAKIMLD